MKKKLAVVGIVVMLVLMVPTFVSNASITRYVVKEDDRVTREYIVNGDGEIMDSRTFLDGKLFYDFDKDWNVDEDEVEYVDWTKD